jgi:flagellar motor switch protein FliN/FliY
MVEEDNSVTEQETPFSEEAGRPENLDVVLDIPVRLSMEVGTTNISIRKLLQLSKGSLVELARSAGEPLDVLVNGTLIAQGEAVVVNDKLGIRLLDIISPEQRIKSIN